VFELYFIYFVRNPGVPLFNLSIKSNENNKVGWVESKTYQNPAMVICRTAE